MAQKNAYKNLVKNVSNFWTVGIGCPGKIDKLQLVFWDKTKLDRMKHILIMNNIAAMANAEGLVVLMGGNKLSAAEQELVRALKSKDYAKDNILVKMISEMARGRA